MRESKSGVSTWERATSPDESAVAAGERERLRSGVGMGALLGLAYGLVSQLANPIALPGVPPHQPPACCGHHSFPRKVLPRLPVPDAKGDAELCQLRPDARRGSIAEG